MAKKVVQSDPIVPPSAWKRANEAFMGVKPLTRVETKDEMLAYKLLSDWKKEMEDEHKRLMAEKNKMEEERKAVEE
jgi:hypothetical protein